MKPHVIRANRLLDLQNLLFQFAEVERFIHFPDGKKINRRENNSEHSFSLAMAAWFLASAYPHLDRDKLIRYALIHDLVEVYAGDVQAVGRSDAVQKDKEEREHQAFLRLKKEWPDFPDMTDHIESYEARSDSESKFVYALDKLMPLLLNILSQGKTWKKYGFTQEDVYSAKDQKLLISPEVNELWRVLRDMLTKNSSYFGEKK